MKNTILFITTLLLSVSGLVLLLQNEYQYSTRTIEIMSRTIGLILLMIGLRILGNKMQD